MEQDGKRLIDVKAADEARRQRKRSHGPGGSPEQREQAKARWRARAGQGYDYGQLGLLGALRKDGPRVLAELMRLAGSKDENEIARAAASLSDMINAAAVVLFDEFNHARVTDYRVVLPHTETPDLPDDALDLFYETCEGFDGEWGEDLLDRAFDIISPVFAHAVLHDEYRRKR